MPEVFRTDAHIGTQHAGGRIGLCPQGAAHALRIDRCLLVQCVARVLFVWEMQALPTAYRGTVPTVALWCAYRLLHYLLGRGTSEQQSQHRSGR